MRIFSPVHGCLLSSPLNSSFVLVKLISSISYFSLQNSQIVNVKWHFCSWSSQCIRDMLSGVVPVWFSSYGSHWHTLCTCVTDERRNHLYYKQALICLVFFFSSSPYEIFSSLQYIRANKPLCWITKCNKLRNSWTQFSYIYIYQEIWFIYISFALIDLLAALQ